MQRVTKKAKGVHNVLPLYHQRSGTSIKTPKLIHLIPVLIFICFFILWWFSYPVKLEVNDGRNTEATVNFDEEKPKSLNETRIDVAFLAATAPPPYLTVSGIQTAAEPPTNGTD